MKTKQTDLITDEQTFDGAVYHRAEFSIQTYDDGYGPLWISRDSMGINGIVRARTWEDAYSICEDEFFSEADETIEEIIKEYGYKRESFKVVKDSTITVATDHCSAGERFAVSTDYAPALIPEFVRWVTVETPDPDAWMDNELFQEGFGFRPNGPNVRDTLKHGIYSKDLNGDALDRLTAEMIDDLGITLQIGEPAE
jgi:hypothetical protein